MLLLAFKLPSYLFGNTRGTSVMHENAKYVCFIYMQPQREKFKSVQLKIKQVSYILMCYRLKNLNYDAFLTLKIAFILAKSVYCVELWLFI